VTQLRLQRCLVFCQTFNRGNLRYEVRRKAKNVLEDMLAAVVSRYRPQPVHAPHGQQQRGYGGRPPVKVPCGIIYCFSQADCERLAAAICARPPDEHFPFGIRALPYHAGESANRAANHSLMLTITTTNTPPILFVRRAAGAGAAREPARLEHRPCAHHVRHRRLWHGYVAHNPVRFVP
jgi:hypothetical protein